MLYRNLTNSIDGKSLSAHLKMPQLFSRPDSAMEGFVKPPRRSSDGASFPLGGLNADYALFLP
jgi:hypothetical protein